MMMMMIPGHPRPMGRPTVHDMGYLGHLLQGCLATFCLGHLLQGCLGHLLQGCLGHLLPRPLAA